MKRFAMMAALVALAGPRARPAGPGRPGAPRVPEDVGRLRQHQQRRLRHHEQHDDAVGRGVPQDVPEREGPGGGQGQLHRARPPSSPAPRSSARCRARCAPPRSTSSRPSTATSRRSCAPPTTRSPSTSTRTTRSRSSPSPQVDAVFSKTRRRGVQAERHDLGPARPHRRLGEPPDQPLRPQLGLRHLRLLQGARAQQRRLQGQREGAAGLRLGRPGRDRGPLRHGLLGHRLQDLGRQGRGARRRRTATPSPPAATRT